MRAVIPYLTDIWFALAVVVLPLLTRRNGIAFWVCCISGGVLLILLWILEYAPLRENLSLYVLSAFATSLASASLAGWSQRLKERRRQSHS